MDNERSDIGNVRCLERALHRVLQKARVETATLSVWRQSEFSVALTHRFCYRK
jgi:hypothetical protein